MHGGDGITYRRFRLEQIEDAPSGTDRFLIRTEQRRERADRTGDIQSVKQKRDERARSKAAVEHQPATLPEHGDDSAESRESESSEKRAANARPPDRRRDDITEMRSVPPDFFRFAREALNRSDLGERFLGGSGRLSDAVLYASARPAESAAEHERCTDHQRHHGERGCSEQRMGEREQDNSADQKQRLARELREGVAEKDRKSTRLNS